MKFFASFFLCVSIVYCSFGQVCVPVDTISEPGDFFPRASDLPCIDRGVPYSSIIYFRNYDTIEPIFFNVNSIIFDSITNLPLGITWQADRQPPLYERDSFGCITFSGTTNAPPGEYQIGLWVTLDIDQLGPSSGNLSPSGVMGQQCINYIFRVKNSVDPCPQLTDTTCSGINSNTQNLISGIVYYDKNGNGIKDSGENGMSSQVAIVTPVNYSAITNHNGFYVFAVNAGNHTVTLQNSQLWSVSSSPTSYSVVITGTDTLVSGLDFGLVPIDSVDDVRISITGSPARPGFLTTHWIDYENVGTLVSNGVVSYTYDSVFTSAYPDITPDSVNGRTMYWNYTNLYPGEHRSMRVILEIPPDVNLLGDTLVSRAYIDVLENDANFADNSDVLEQEVTGSYDPNDKAVSPNHPDGVRPEWRLNYTIRFQNTGTDTAFTVVIRDTLDTDLNVETLSMLGASHAYSLDIKDDRYITWTFDNILLPDSNVNEPESHGFVKYSIDMNDNIAHGTEVTNLAGIYFDFNPPIITNTTKSEVNFFLGIADRESLISSYIYPNPTDGRATIVLGQYVNNFEVELYDYLGRKVLNSQDNRGNRFEIDHANLTEGMYIYRVTSKGELLSSGKLVMIE